MTEKNIFVYKLFLSLNNSNFSLFFFLFLVKLQSPLKKVTPSFPATPSQKLRSCQVPPPLFENLVGGSTPPAERRGCTLCTHLHYLISSLSHLCWEIEFYQDFPLIFQSLTQLPSHDPVPSMGDTG